jgi:hypothetical protein
MKAEQKVALDLLKEAFINFCDSLTDDEAPTAEPKGKKTTTKKVETTAEVKSEYSREELDEMSYNNIKTLAKNLGLSAKGDRETLIEMILSSGDDSADEEQEAPKQKASKPKGKKTPEPEPEEDEEESDDLETMVNNAVAEMTDGEILEFLLESGIKAKGKRQALIAAVIKGVREGKIELSEEEDEEESEDEDEESETEFGVNDFDNPEMPEDRAAGIKDFAKEIKNSFKEEELTREDMINFINEYNGTKDKMKKVKDKELLEQYTEIACMFIDDDGELHSLDCSDPEAYFVNGVPFCCGKELKYDEETQMYICEECGTEYPAEDDD